MSENLTPKQRKALETYVLTGSATEAAAAGNVSRQTFYQWRAEPRFVEQLRRLDGDALQNLGRRIMALSEAACAALADALAEDQPIAIRLRAAAIVTERGPALAELSALIERVNALEALQHGQS